jgi:hypothetical protein
LISVLDLLLEPERSRHPVTGVSGGTFGFVTTLIEKNGEAKKMIIQRNPESPEEIGLPSLGKKKKEKRAERNDR